MCAIFAKARHRQSDAVPKCGSSGWQGGKCAAKAAVEYVLLKKEPHMETTVLYLSAAF